MQLPTMKRVTQMLWFHKETGSGLDVRLEVFNPKVDQFFGMY